MLPIFSILIPTYNQKNFLKRALDSVLSQSFGNFEVLVIDDGSTDGTQELINSYSDKRIHYEWMPNSGGPAGPRNAGIENSRGGWIAFLDADDFWFPNKLQSVAEVISAHHEIDVICHNEYSQKSCGGRRLLFHGPYESDFYKVLLIQGNRLSTSAVVVRSEFLNSNKLRFNLSNNFVIVEDYDLWLSIAFCQGRFYFMRDILGVYSVGNESLSSNFRNVQSNRTHLLRHHVFNIQNFEKNKNKLWSIILARLAIQEGKFLVKTKGFPHGALFFLSTAVRSPKGLMLYIWFWGLRRVRRFLQIWSQ